MAAAGTQVGAHGIDADDSQRTARQKTMLSPRPSSMAFLLVAAALTGCAGNVPELPSLTGSSADTGEARPPGSNRTEVASAMATSPAGSEEPRGIPIPGAVGSATDIYSHIASGAMACWFSASGPLKKEYIFHATADAPSRGGKAEVVVHVRDPSASNPRGPKAYVVEIGPKGEAAADVRVENRKMPAALATAMNDDIALWSKGEKGCALVKAVAAATAPPADSTAAKKATASPTKHGETAKKPKLKAAQAKPATPQQAPGTQP
jgi:hypothetical protein